MFDWIRNLFGGVQYEEQIEEIVKPKAPDYYSEAMAQLKTVEEKPKSSPTNQGKDADSLVAELLATSFPKTHIKLLDNSIIKSKKNIVYVEPNNIKIHCQIIDIQHVGQIKFLTFRFVTELSNGQTFVEELCSQGNTDFVAIFEGVVQFCEGFLKTFLFSYSEYNDPNYDIITKNGKWLLNYGIFSVQGAFKNEDFDHRHLADVLYPKLLEISSSFELEYYCIKIYLSRMNGDKFTGECWVNDVEWQAGLNQLISQDFSNWKMTTEFLAKKQFIFLKKVD